MNSCYTTTHKHLLNMNYVSEALLWRTDTWIIECFPEHELFHDLPNAPQSWFLHSISLAELSSPLPQCDIYSIFKTQLKNYLPSDAFYGSLASKSGRDTLSLHYIPIASQSSLSGRRPWYFLLIVVVFLL